MNKYEQRADRERKAVLRNSMMLGTAGVALLVVVLLIVGLSSSAPPRFFSVTAIAVALVLLVLRQLSRRLKGKTPRAARPDPRSTLKLH
jgi:protein-S-isoprenylcysteine O-methyltransferase Ste14